MLLGSSVLCISILSLSLASLSFSMRVLIMVSCSCKKTFSLSTLRFLSWTALRADRGLSLGGGISEIFKAALGVLASIGSDDIFLEADLVIIELGGIGFCPGFLGLTIF